MLGVSPTYAELDKTGLDYSEEQFNANMALNPSEWQAELESQTELFDKAGNKLPDELEEQPKSSSRAFLKKLPHLQLPPDIKAAHSIRKVSSVLRQRISNPFCKGKVHNFFIFFIKEYNRINENTENCMVKYFQKTIYQ